MSNKNIDINIPYLEGSNYDTEPESFTHKITSLFLAVLKGNVEIVKMLLENNELNVDTKCFYIKDNRSFNQNTKITALKLAEYNKQASIVELLKERSNQSEEIEPTQLIKK